MKKSMDKNGETMFDICLVSFIEMQVIVLYYFEFKIKGKLSLIKAILSN